MFIAVNKISASSSQKEAMVEGFKKAGPGMKQFSGFLGLEIWTEQDGSLLAVSRWTSKEAMDEYTSNALFRSHHRGTSAEQPAGQNQTLYYEGEQII
jgi:heme-degrading monooxygenase HmoA